MKPFLPFILILLSGCVSYDPPPLNGTTTWQPNKETRVAVLLTPERDAGGKYRIFPCPRCGLLPKTDFTQRTCPNGHIIHTKP